MLKRDDPKFQRATDVSATGAEVTGIEVGNAAKLRRVKASLRPLGRKCGERDHLKIRKATEFQRQGGIEVGMPRNSTISAQSPQSVTPYCGSRNAAKLNESMRYALCGRKCGVELVAEAYKLNRDDPKFKGNGLSATATKGTRSRNAFSPAKVIESKRYALCGRKCGVDQVAEALHATRGITRKSNVEQVAEALHAQRGMTRNSKATDFRNPGASKSECRELTESKRFAVVEESACGKTSSRSIHAQEGSPEIQRQLNFGNRGIEVGMPGNSPSQSISPFVEEKCWCKPSSRSITCSTRNHPKFKGN
ncbi:hypothetical protein D5086_033984 [Populus alba]|uniref:Uncharacterized protein n=1 Tax=Populus alba TaxID=43335 RepID=A0ACC4AFE3_POPAL